MSEAMPIPTRRVPVAVHPAPVRRTGSPRLVRSSTPDSSKKNDSASEPAAAKQPTLRPVTPPRDVLVNLVRCYVQAHIERPIPVGELVSVIGVTESTLRRAIVSESGLLLAQFITNVRLDRAHALLSTNREARSITELAAALGFNSAAVFSRRYRLRFGETISETRRRAVISHDARSGEKQNPEFL